MSLIRGNGRLRIAFVGAASLSVVACSALLSFDGTQCATSADCAARGSATPLVCSAGACVASAALPGDGGSDGASNAHGADWACVPAGVPEGGAPPSTVTIVALDGQSTLVPEYNKYTVRTGVSVRLCGKRDPGCVHPLTSTTPVDANGSVTFPTPSVLDFYTEVTGSGVTPVMHFPAVTANNVARLKGTFFVGTLSTSDTQTLAALVNVNVDPTAGIVLVRPVNCNLTFENVAGITFKIAPPGASLVQFYTTGGPNGLPSVTATATDSAGLGGFINEPPQAITITTSFPADGGVAAVQIGTASAFTRAGWMSIVETAPTAQ